MNGDTPNPAVGSGTIVLNDTGFSIGDAIIDLAGLDFNEPDDNGKIAEGLAPEVVITTTSGSVNLAETLNRGARWVHTIGTGVDEFPFELLTDQVLTCSRGASAEPIGEWVLAQMLAFAKGLPDTWLHSPPDRWGFDKRIGSLRGATVVIVGVGGIGTEVARLSLALGMRVVGVRRTDAAAPLAGMEITTDLRSVIGEADHLVLAAPATGATARLLDHDTLALVRPGVHLVNIARGALVDQDALLDALDDHRVARASLDVCDPEPLPADHWLYSHPAVKLSPHASWVGPTALDTMIDLFVDNYHRWRAGEPLRGVVDTVAGY